jgi:hypothetical protein
MVEVSDKPCYKLQTLTQIGSCQLAASYDSKL